LIIIGTSPAGQMLQNCTNFQETIILCQQQPRL
jgi:hypothetical protein